MKRIIIALCLLTVAFHSVAFAEPYKSSKFPPDDMLSKVVAKYTHSEAGFIGKFKHNDNSYTIYCAYLNGHVKTISLVRLDTNIWIYNSNSIVQK